MLKRKTQAIKSLHITTSFGKDLSETAKSLSFLARQAHLNKDFYSLRSLSEDLINLSPRLEDTGRFFYALSQSKYGYGDLDSAYKIITSLLESQSLKIRAACSLAIGRKELFLGNYDEATRILLKSSGMALLEGICAPITYIQSQIALSAICAETGANKESLAIIEGIEPLMKSIGNRYPALLGEYWNNKACGYMEAGDLDAAFYYSQKAVSMKVAVNFPQWFETRQEIDEKLYEKNFHRIAYLGSYDRAEISDKVHKLSPKVCFQVYLDYYGNRAKLLDYYTNESEESSSRFTALIHTLSAFIVNENTEVKVEGFFSPKDDEPLIFQGNIARKNLRNLFKVIDNVEVFEKNNPLKEYSVDSTADEATIQDTMAWLLPMLEESTK